MLDKVFIYYYIWQYGWTSNNIKARLVAKYGDERVREIEKEKK